MGELGILNAHEANFFANVLSPPIPGHLVKGSHLLRIDALIAQTIGCHCLSLTLISSFQIALNVFENSINIEA